MTTSNFGLVQLDENMQTDFPINSTRKTKTIANDRIKGLQISHFLLYNMIPLVGFIIAMVSLWWFPIGPVEVGLLIGMWALTMTGLSVGCHRYFSHHAFKANEAVRVTLGILGSMAAQGSVISWVAVHRRHHECSDELGDPHSPNLHGNGILGMIRGVWHSHYGWLVNHEYPNPAFYALDLLRDKTIAKVNRYYVSWIILGLVIPAVLGGVLEASWIGAVKGFLWGGIVRMFLVDCLILSNNWILHIYGTRPFETGDQSRNNFWMAIPFLGESWHNNHHAFPTSASAGLKWWQIDLGYWIICVLEKFGWVWDVNVPSAKMIEAKLSKKTPSSVTVLDQTQS
ncbi:acyl-CoA desaturase [Amazonocrinis nigriterrae]|nr:acyl-CoA desaturase [Amazonocrinis nigriterrae]